MTCEKKPSRILKMFGDETLSISYIDTEEHTVSNEIVTVAWLYDNYRDMTFTSVSDTFGRFSSIEVKPDIEETTAYIMKAMSGSAHATSGENTCVYTEVKTGKTVMKTVAELATEVKFEEVTPAVFAPIKRTHLEDADFFLENLDSHDNKYFINLSKIDGVDNDIMFQRLRQLSNAGITGRALLDEKLILIGEMQPICWPLKLFINGLSSNKKEFDLISGDIIARNVIDPYSLWTEEEAQQAYDVGVIYEGSYKKNMLPIMPPTETSEKVPTYTIEVYGDDIAPVQSTWYCS